MSEQLKIRLICTQDAGYLIDLVADEITALGHKVIRPVNWSKSSYKPSYNVVEQRADFAVVILTPEYVSRARLGLTWVTDSSAEDTLYVWHNYMPEGRGPWNAPHTIGAVIAYLDNDNAREEIRRGFEDLTRRCDGCGNLCRGSYLQSINLETKKITRTLCNMCDRNALVMEYQDTGKITTKLMMDATIDQHSDRLNLPVDVSLRVNADCERINQAIEQFELQAWFGSDLQSYCKNARVRGHELEAENVSVLMYELAGRVMITFRRKDSDVSVTTLCVENSTTLTMGLHGIYATGDEAIQLINEANAAIGQGAQFHSNTQLSI